jgi:peptidase M42 family hydrolase
MIRPKIDPDYLQQTMLELLQVHSPTGMTDDVVQLCCRKLEELGIKYELTRRGAIRATLPGATYSPDRAIAAHLDTLGAMIKRLKDNGRAEVVPVGTWPARSAEGARVTVFADEGRHYRGTLLPLKASGHVYNEGVDEQPAHWQNIELRIDEVTHSRADLEALGLAPGDYVAIHPQPELLDNGFWVSRFLDDKAGVAAVLAAAKAVLEQNIALPIDCHLLFTITEETGVGASHVLHGDCAELIAVDNGTIAEEQETSEYGVTIAMLDSSGPFDYYLTRRLSNLCKRFRHRAQPRRVPLLPLRRRGGPGGGQRYPHGAGVFRPGQLSRLRAYPPRFGGRGRQPAGIADAVQDALRARRGGPGAPG